MAVIDPGSYAEDMQAVAQSITSPASPVEPAVFDTVRKVAASVWPSVPVIPVMDTGGSDAV